MHASHSEKYPAFVQAPMTSECRPRPRGERKDGSAARSQQAFLRESCRRQRAGAGKRRSYRRAPPREGPGQESRVMLLCMFQSAPLREGRLGTSGWPGCSASFQSAPLREGRPYSARAPASASLFQSAPCVRGDRARRALAQAGRGFNPRPCVRGDQRHPPAARPQEVSIRAPA